MKRPPSSDRRRSPGLWEYWFGLELLQVLASEERVLQRRECLFWLNVSRALTRVLEGVLWYEYPQPDDRASSEVDDGVNSDHFQVQLNSTGPLHGAGHHQSGTDWSCLLCIKQEKPSEIAKTSSSKLMSRYSLQAAKIGVFCFIVWNHCNWWDRVSFQHLASFQCELLAPTVCKAFRSLAH